MPVLSNPRWELYCQGLALGKRQTTAYIEAGFDVEGATANTNASRLAKHPDISARVGEIMKIGERETIRKIALNRGDIIKMLLEDREFAKSQGQASSAIRAAELLGKELGMFVDRKEVKTGLLDDVDITELDAVREELIRESARRIAAATGGSGASAEDRAVLPGLGAAAQVALPETSDVLRGGDDAQAAPDVPERV